jgi:hypothetical protein
MLGRRAQASRHGTQLLVTTARTATGCLHSAPGNAACHRRQQVRECALQCMCWPRRCSCRQLPCHACFGLLHMVARAALTVSYRVLFQLAWVSYATAGPEQVADECVGFWFLQTWTTSRSGSAATTAAAAVVSAPRRARPHHRLMQPHHHHSCHHRMGWPLQLCPGCSQPKGMWSAPFAAYLSARASSAAM